MKAITIMGVIGRDAQLRQAGSDNVCSFSVAVDDGFGQNKKTLWFDVSIWGKRATSLESILTKGKSVAVSGDLSTREYNGKTSFTIRANEITLARGQQQSGGYDQSPARDPQTPVPGFDSDPEIPF